MQPRTRALLADALRAGTRIQDKLSLHTVESFVADEDAQLVVERCFEIVGEAIRVLNAMKAPELSLITEFERIIALRNVIAHQYAVIKPARIWVIATESLPLTLDEIHSILDSDSD